LMAGLSPEFRRHLQLDIETVALVGSDIEQIGIKTAPALEETSFESARTSSMSRSTIAIFTSLTRKDFVGAYHRSSKMTIAVLTAGTEKMPPQLAVVVDDEIGAGGDQEIAGK